MYILIIIYISISIFSSDSNDFKRAELKKKTKSSRASYLAKCPLGPVFASRGPTLEISLSSHVATVVQSRAKTQQRPVRNFAIKEKTARLLLTKVKNANATNCC